MPPGGLRIAPQPPEFLVLLTAAQRVDVGRDRADLRFAQTRGAAFGGIAPRGHDAGAAEFDGLGDGGLIVAIEPDRVGQVRCAHLLHALGVFAVAGGAVVGKDLRAGRGFGGIGLLARDLQHVLHNVVDLGLVEQTVGQMRRHRRGRIGVRIQRVTDAVLHVGVDLFDRAAMQPVAVEQVREARVAARARAVALRTPGAEHRAAGVAGEVDQFRIVGDLVQVGRHQLFLDRLVGVGILLDVGRDIGAGRAVQKPGRRPRGEDRPGRHRDRVGHAPDDAGVEGPQPPARQRVVVLGNAVPRMARGLDLLLGRRFFAHVHASLQRGAVVLAAAVLAAAARTGGFVIMSEGDACRIVVDPARAGAQREDDGSHEDQEHRQRSPAVGEFTEDMVVHPLPPQRLATGSKVEKSTIVPRTCR
ncbi:hypothetical protein SDC9_19912 [bioreactor metagenome]|uniref:Uncharacterized protein n=1 Tax=bioreactor metagenome TaxID=1076179 RepID=A0A644U5A5_9ZZZZ